ncbi:ABC transporter permease [Ilumatobacter sp.]|uniref:ABC transporter permease n=1 Tax=Ilumatobacter sp. TaxID=1967498 RepID=UPI003750570D
MAQFISKKVLGSTLTLVFVLVFNFFLFRVVQPDPVANLFRGRNVPQARLDQMRTDFGLDGSRLTQFWAYLRETLQLNLGFSYQSRQPVWDDIASKIWPTVQLVGLAAILSAAIGIIGGVIAGWRRGSAADYSITSTTMAFYSMPDFWLGMLLLVAFAVVFPWFPVGGMTELGVEHSGVGAILDRLHHLALPCLTLTLAYLGEYAIVTRSSLLDVMGEEYLTLAQAKGLRDIQVRNRHAVPNALLPVVTLAAINFGFVLSGAIAVETLFSWPGLGKATSDAVLGPDLPMLQGLFLVFSAAVIVFNLAADVLYAFLDPRVRPA